jgi:hypothetical protein
LTGSSDAILMLTEISAKVATPEILFVSTDLDAVNAKI